MKCKTCKKNRNVNDNGLCGSCQKAADQAAQARGHRPAQTSVAAVSPASEGNRRSGNGPQPVNRQGLKRGRPS
jgi:hypothetical protein